MNKCHCQPTNANSIYVQARRKDREMTIMRRSTIQKENLYTEEKKSQEKTITKSTIKLETGYKLMFLPQSGPVPLLQVYHHKVS